MSDPAGSLVGIDLGQQIQFRLTGLTHLPDDFWLKLECVQKDVVRTRIWMGPAIGTPVILAHVPGFGYFRRLVVDAGTLGWDDDVVYRHGDVLIRFVTGTIEAEVTGDLKPINAGDGKITIQGSQETLTATGRFIEVVAPDVGAIEAELHAQALLGVLALGLGQNVLGRVVSSEPWHTGPDAQLGQAIVFGREAPRQASGGEFEPLGGLIDQVIQDGRVPRARIIALAWYERGFRSVEPLDRLLSYYIGVESLVTAFARSKAPIPVEEQRKTEDQAAVLS